MGQTPLAVRAETALQIKFGQEEINLIKTNFCPNATQAEFNLFLYDCQSRGLNPLKKEIHFVKYGNKTQHIVGIDGYRIMACKSGEYEGQTGVEYGKEIEYKGEKVPEWAEIGVWRKGAREATKARAYFKEYAKVINGKLGDMWKNMPRNQLAKCAEALALRKAFPDYLAGIYTSDEMDQASVKADYDVNVENGEVVPTPAGKAMKKATETGEAQTIPSPDVKMATKKQVGDFEEWISKLGDLKNFTDEQKEDAMNKITINRDPSELTEQEIKGLTNVLKTRYDQEQKKLEDEKQDNLV